MGIKTDQKGRNIYEKKDRNFDLSMSYAHRLFRENIDEFECDCINCRGIKFNE